MRSVWLLSISILACCLSNILIEARIQSPVIKKGSELPRIVSYDFQRDDFDGHGCDDCHSPDGIELSRYSFDRTTILRRAAIHYPPTLQLRVTDYLLSSRRSTLNSNDPILVPGGAILDGNGPLARDADFLMELKKRVPRLFGSPLQTSEDVKNTSVQLNKVDPRDLKCGMEFNLLAEDGFKDSAHATVADWIPDVVPPGMHELRDIRNEYLKDPIEKNLELIDVAVKNLKPNTPIEQLAQNKYRVLLLLQDQLRKRNGVPRLDKVKLISTDNPFWNIAEVGRRNGDADQEFLGLSKDLAQRKSSGPSLATQMKGLRLPWYWLGWCMDQGITRSGLSPETRRGDYFCKALWNDGPYPSHMAFMLLKRMSSRLVEKQNWRKDIPSRFEIQYSFFLLSNKLQDFNFTDQNVNIQFRAFVANCFRFSLLQEEFELKRCGFALRPSSQLLQIKDMEAIFDKWKTGAEDQVLCYRVANEIKEAKPIYR